MKCGVFIQDIDGTSNTPGKKEEIYPPLIEADARFIQSGGTLILSTNRPKFWVEEKIITPIIQKLTQSGKNWSERAKKKIILMPEQASAIQVIKKVGVEPKALEWETIYSLNVPEKLPLKKFLTEEIIPGFPGSSIRVTEFVVSLVDLASPTKTLELVEKLKADSKNIPWDSIRIIPTRSTITFIHWKAGKKKTLVECMKFLPKIFNDAKIFGVGDSGDDFADLIPTFNVGEPDAFKEKGLSSLEYGKFKILGNGEYTLEKNNVFTLDGGKINVLRDAGGKLITLQVSGGQPIQILEKTIRKRLQAGPATTKILKTLMCGKE